MWTFGQNVPVGQDQPATADRIREVGETEGQPVYSEFHCAKYRTFTKDFLAGRSVYLRIRFQKTGRWMRMDFHEEVWQAGFHLGAY